MRNGGTVALPTPAVDRETPGSKARVAGGPITRCTCRSSAHRLPPVTTCPSCGHENPDGSKFCKECATPLGAPARPSAEERKVVTALFCDLVGFTAASESADPEDVDQMLSAYAAMARTQIESHGGVVEKFIGDAVVGIFGVPAAHEDDPERAVRAGLRICEDAEDLEAIGGAPLRLRVGDQHRGDPRSPRDHPGLG